MSGDPGNGIPTQIHKSKRLGQDDAVQLGDLCLPCLRLHPLSLALMRHKIDDHEPEIMTGLHVALPRIPEPHDQANFGAIVLFFTPRKSRKEIECHASGKKGTSGPVVVTPIDVREYSDERNRCLRFFSGGGFFTTFRLAFCAFCCCSGRLVFL